MDQVPMKILFAVDFGKVHLLKMGNEAFIMLIES